MAKQRKRKPDSLIDLLRSIDGKTIVRSWAYGYHLRAKRGTYKKAALNTVCKKQTEKLVRANDLARIIKIAIDPYRSRFRARRLWPRLLSHILEHENVETSFDFSKFQPFDLCTTYPLDRIVKLTTQAVADTTRSVLGVRLSIQQSARFQDERIDGFQFRVIAIFPDPKGKSARTEAVRSEVIGLNGKPPVELEVPVPEGAETFLICVRVDGCVNGKIDGALSTTGMKITAAGRVTNHRDEPAQ